MEDILLYKHYHLLYIPNGDDYSYNEDGYINGHFIAITNYNEFMRTCLIFNKKEYDTKIDFKEVFIDYSNNRNNYHIHNDVFCENCNKRIIVEENQTVEDCIKQHQENQCEYISKCIYPSEKTKFNTN